MRPATARTLLPILLALSPLAVAAQDPPKEDPGLPAQLAELDHLVSDRKMQQDMQAVGLMQQLKKNAEHRHPKDRQRIGKALADVFKTGKVREGAADILYREAGDALAEFGEDGAKELARTITHKRIKDNISLQAHLAVALGRTKDPKQIDWLLDTAIRSPHSEMRAACGEALGNFTQADEKRQHEIVRELIRAWGSLHAEATRLQNPQPGQPVDPGPQNARDILRVVEGRWVGTLQRLTGTSQSTFPDWQHWLNKNPDWLPPGLKK